MQPLLFLVFFLNLSPSYDALINIYLKKLLGFSNIDLADMSSCSTLFYIISLYLY
jgi:hypothetical protein